MACSCRISELLWLLQETWATHSSYRSKVTHSSCRSEASGTESAKYQMCGCWECNKSDSNEALLRFSSNYFGVDVDVHFPTQLLMPLLNRILDGDLEALQLLLWIPVTAGSAAAPQLHLLHLLLPSWICFSCFCLIVSGSAAAHCLPPLQLLLPICVHFSCSPISFASASAPRLHPL